jgi:hypothetical protein
VDCIATSYHASNNWEELEELEFLTEVSYYELKVAGINMKFDTGRNERGDRTYVIIDANNRHWDYEPDSELYYLSEDLYSPYLDI